MHTTWRIPVRCLGALLLLGIPTLCSAQATSPPWIQGFSEDGERDAGPPELAPLAAASERYFDTQTRGSRSGYKHFQRWLWLAQQRLGPEGHLINTTEADRQACQAVDPHGMRPADTWQPLGPTHHKLTPTGFDGGQGRINDLTVGPDGTLYVASSTGGLWRRGLSRNAKLADAGNTKKWTPLTNLLTPIPALSSVVVDPKDPATIYLLTGDANGTYAPSGGVLKSVNGGATWKNVGPSFRGMVYGYDLAIDPRQSQTLLAATTLGLFRTQDGGQQWSNVLPAPESGTQYFEIAFHPSEPAVVYAAGVQNGSGVVQRSTDGGSNWTQLSDGLPALLGGVQRLALAVTPAAPDSLYVLYGGGVGYQGLYVSEDKGETFEMRSNSPNLLGYEPDGSSQLSAGIPWYALALAVSPQDPNEVYVGSQNVWRSKNGGTSWSITSYWDDREDHGDLDFLHNDIHHLLHLGGQIYVATDGGVSESKDGAKTWRDLSRGLNITQIYKINTVPDDKHMLYFAAQDNGTGYLRHQVGHQMVGYDGTAVLVDHAHPHTVTDVLTVRRTYVGYQWGGLLKSAPNSITRWLDAMPPLHLTSRNRNYITPFILVPSTSTRSLGTLFGCYEDLWTSSDGTASWENLTKGKIDPTAPCAAFAVAQGTIYVVKGFSWNTVDDPEKLKPKIWYSSGDRESWTDITGNLARKPPEFWISDIMMDPESPNVAWVSIGSYGTDKDGVANVYATSGNSLWKPLTDGLPAVPVYTLYYDQIEKSLYAGTQCGVYRNDLDAEQPTWVLASAGMPRVAVMDLEIQRYAGGQRFLYAGTLAQGAWRKELSKVSAAPDAPAGQP